MIRLIFVLPLLAVIISATAMGQETTKENTESPAAENKPGAVSRPEDVASIDAIIKATYDVISGAAGEKRDWDRFRNLFHADARLIPTGRNPDTGDTGARAFAPDEYIRRSEPFMLENGFYEKEIARRVEVYGNIGHVFSTYEGRNKLTDEKPFLRGINSFQLLYDGKRWWVVTIYWQGESPSSPLPEKYLKSDQ